MLWKLITIIYVGGAIYSKLLTSSKKALIQEMALQSQISKNDYRLYSKR